MHYKGVPEYDDNHKVYSVDEADKKNLVEKIRDELKQVTEMCFSFLHGSFIEGKAFRDIDIAIYLDDYAAANKGEDICNRLSVRLTGKTGIPVDVNLLNSASLGFCYHASKGRILTCRQLEEAYQFKEDTWIKYMDFYHLLRENTADLFSS